MLCCHPERTKRVDGGQKEPIWLGEGPTLEAQAALGEVGKKWNLGEL